ncbi:hypothetical protein [uncultured Algibacter sp.]|uniref:hypothetical protein n=1 Tax=uncultured Algibacter sp. TaxID=298659 RepID=UPI002621E4DA|nr:hypothetical protein [uncultured Algibacter sp.]
MKTHLVFAISLVLSLKLSALTYKNSWINLFPKNGMNINYKTTEKTNTKNNKLFKVKKNKIKVLCSWKDTQVLCRLITKTKAYSHSMSYSH